MSSESSVVRICEGLFPFQALLGISGNLINLLVLFSRPMRSKTNTLLALAAISDVFFLLALIPNNISRRHSWMFTTNCPFSDQQNSSRRCYSSFALFYASHKQNFTFLANWFSSDGSWLLVAVSFDRLWAIKSPFPASARRPFCPFRQALLVIIIFLSNAGLTLHNNFVIKTSANGILNYSNSSFSTELSGNGRDVVALLAVLNIFTQTLLPLLLLVSLNFFLLYYLRHRRHMFTATSSQDGGREELPPLLLAGHSAQQPPFPAPRNWSRQMAKAERHITVTVTAILSCYVITHLPSAFVYAKISLFTWRREDVYRRDKTMYPLVALSTAVLVSGKVANFFLFCLSSKHFRRQLRKQFLSFLRHPSASIRDSVNLPRTRSLPLNTLDNNSARASP